MVDSESQSVLRKEEPFMVTITLHCPHCQSEALVRNGHAPNGKQLYRCRACGRQSRENPTPMPIQKLAARRSCMPIKNEAVSAASRARLASLAPRCPIGSKKRNSASSLKYHPACPRSRRCRFHHAGTGWLLLHLNQNKGILMQSLLLVERMTN